MAYTQTLPNRTAAPPSLLPRTSTASFPRVSFNQAARAAPGTFLGERSTRMSAGATEQMHPTRSKSPAPPRHALDRRISASTLALNPVRLVKKAAGMGRSFARAVTLSNIIPWQGPRSGDSERRVIQCVDIGAMVEDTVDDRAGCRRGHVSVIRDLLQVPAQPDLEAPDASTDVSSSRHEHDVKQGDEVDESGSKSPA